MEAAQSLRNTPASFRGKIFPALMKPAQPGALLGGEITQCFAAPAQLFFLVVRQRFELFLSPTQPLLLFGR